MVVLDTSIIIDHLRSSRSRPSLLRDIVEKYPKESFALSLLSVQELYEGQSSLSEAKEKDLLATISPLKLLPYTYEIAKSAGIIARDVGRSIELADAAIAATAIANRAKLYTLNLRDFRDIPHLDLWLT